jgi:hypothetical protein
MVAVTSPVMAYSQGYQEYKRAVQALADKYGSQMTAAGKDLPILSKEIAAMEGDIQKLTDKPKVREVPTDLPMRERPLDTGDQKRLQELQGKVAGKKKAFDQKLDQVNQLAAQLARDLTLVRARKLDRGEDKELPGLVGDIVKAKGLPVAPGVTLVPNVSFGYDFDAGTLRAARSGTPIAGSAGQLRRLCDRLPNSE